MAEITVTARNEVVIGIEGDQVDVADLQRSKRGLSWTTPLGEQEFSRRPVAFRT